MDVDDYFNRLREETDKAYDLAEKARDQSKDPEQRIDIPIATDLPEKASSLVIAAMFEELEDQGVAERIRDLEDEYGKNDERVSFQIAREIAEGEFYEFESKERACDAGIRVGVSYMTGGITTAPLEGIGDIKIRENDDGSEYLAVYYSGPIRSAGGTASAMSVLLADYVRIGVGLDRFKPSETVVKRYATEVEDYYNRVTAKQYNPTREETEKIASNVPVEVTGSPTEDLDVSNYKDLDRIDTNRIRGGMCLVYLDGLPLKAPKIKKRIKKWGEEFGLEHWEWVKDYLELQKEIHSSEDEEDEDADEDSKKEEYTPSDKYLGSLTAGRPVFAHPGRKGGFRLRYGHSRTNGLAATSFHPATMEITERFLAIGTQMKMEYPGKATVGTPCDAVHPPVVRLDNGDVVKVETREKARELEKKIEKILFLGDVLVPYGEFVENGKKLLPSPYVEEWWEKELEKALEEQDVKLGKSFDGRTPTPEEAFKISDVLGIPLHPRWQYHWNETSPDRFRSLFEEINEGNIETQKAKNCLEDILVEHRTDEDEIRVREDDLKVLKKLLRVDEDYSDDLEGLENGEDVQEFVSEISGYEHRDQAPHYIGGRMGRPEKAEKRTLNGDPQLLFPCGKEEGGRMRNISASYTQTMHGEQGIVKESIIHNKCPECGEMTYYSFCRDCGVPAEERWFCTDCGKEFEEEQESCSSCGNERFNRYRNTEIDVQELMDNSLENLDMNQPPELLKSFRGMTSKHKHVEPIEKGLLREKYGLYVNKDATVRYDASDLPMTHFKPKEINVSVEKLREIGYDQDYRGEPLQRRDQIVELKPQDIIIPDSDKTLSAANYMMKVCDFVDDLLEQFYDLPPFYEMEDKEDLVGELVIGLAPHTSGGTVGRIIGFTDAKGIYAHPYWHAGKRRNCFHPETEIEFRDEKGWQKKRIDEFVEERISNPREDDFGNKIEEDVENVTVKSVNKEGEKVEKEVQAVSKHQNTELLKITTETGHSIKVTPDHKMQVFNKDKVEKIRAKNLNEGDAIPVVEEEVRKAEVDSIEPVNEEIENTYCLTVKDTHSVIVNGIGTGQCDGDEDAILMMMDGLLNFSRQFLPDMTGARSITKDTRLVVRRNGEVRAPRADELIDEILDNEGFETREDGFEVNRDFSDDIEAVSFDRDSGEVEFRDVSALIRHENDKEVFEVNTSRGKISVTGDHSVFVTEGDEIEARPVRELEEGDCIVVPSNPELEAEGLEDEIDLFELLPDDECYVKVPEDELEELGPEIKAEAGEEVKDEYGEHNIYRYRTGRRDAPLEFYRDVGVVPSCKVRLRANTDPVYRFIENSAELYRLLGYLLSEGDLDRGRITNTGEDVIEDVEHCIRELTGVDPRTHVDNRDGKKKCYWVDTPAVLMRALEELGLEREKFDEKSIPSFVFGAEEEKVEEFIQAYRAGDGSIYGEKGFSKLYTKSGEMATQLSLLVRKLGFKSSTRQAGETWEVLYSEWTDKDPYWPLWDVLDEGREVLREEGADYEEIKQSFSNDRKNDRMKTASKQRVEELYGKGLDSLEKPVEEDVSVERVKEVERGDYGDDYVYDLEVPGNQNFLCGPHPVFAHNTMDAPLILSTVLNPDEVDDEAWAIETVDEYPLGFYEETQEYKEPWDLNVDIEIGEDIVHSDEPFRHGFTHDSSDVENGPVQSEYVTLDEMSEKTSAQLGLGEKTLAADEDATAELLLQKHFLPDIRGNLRSFSSQEMRCVDCNEKFRRVPLTNQTIAPSGKTTAQCPECGGKVLLTISEGTIKKYMQPSKDIIDEYEISPYMRQQIIILNKTLQSLFGKDQRQSGLKQFT
ncbi:MAG: DNA polymerase II large subunit [Candidatus Nanohalobium sp.]